jgi:hypothetical protein
MCPRSKAETGFSEPCISPVFVTAYLYSRYISIKHCDMIFMRLIQTHLETARERLACGFILPFLAWLLSRARAVIISRSGQERISD